MLRNSQIDDEFVNSFPGCSLTADIEVETQDLWQTLGACAEIFQSTHATAKRVRSCNGSFVLFSVEVEDGCCLKTLKSHFSRPGAPKIIRWSTTIGFNREN